MKVQRTFTEERQRPVVMGNSVFTLCDTEAENTDTDKMDTESTHNLCWYLSLCNMSTFIQFYTGHFLSVSVHVPASGNVKTP